MPRRKRNTPPNEGRRKLRRTDGDHDEDTLVISDSEKEEEEDTVTKMSTREARRRERETKAQMQDMTEEEMLDLAMRLSKQEASSAAQRQQLEDDAMRKAIAESLHVGQGQAGDSESASFTAKLSQDPPTVTMHLRRKLSFPCNTETSRANDSEVTAAADSDEDSMRDIKTLPPMPDLSQRTLSQPSPPSPGLSPVPSTASQECHSTQWKDQEYRVLNADTPKDEPSQSNSQAQGSPVFLQECSARMGQDLKSTSSALWNSLSTQDSSLSLTCPDGSQLNQQQSQFPKKSPVFAKTDPKRSIELSKDKVSGTYPTDKVCTPKEDAGEKAEDSSSHKKIHQSRDPRKRLSFYRNLLPSPHISVPDDGVGPKQDVKPKHLKDEAWDRASSNAVPDKVPNSKTSSDNKSLEEFTSHMVLHLSDDDDGDEEEEKIDLSPVFRQERVQHPGSSRLSPTQPCCSQPAVTSTQDSHTLGHSTQGSDSQGVHVQRKFTSKTAYPADTSDKLKVSFNKKPARDVRSTHPMEGKGDSLVSYYWGVPFCPRGQSPDDYTKVILSQLEVYEKSLKEAQRQLLHKEEWSLPLFPCPTERPFCRRMKRHRAPQLLEEEEDEEPDNLQQEKKKELDEKKDKAESQAGSEEGVEPEQSEPYVVVSSPETQEELVQKSASFVGQHGSSNVVKPPSCRKPALQNHSQDTQIEQQPDEHEDAEDERFDGENTVCPETQMTEDDTQELMVTSPAQPQSRAESDMMEVDEGEAAEEERMEQEQAEEEQLQKQKESAPLQCKRVECPMCSRLFPIDKIEMHAAYCDGNTEDQEQQDDLSQITLRKRTRKIPTDETLQGSENRSEQQQECYMCQKCFPGVQEYILHVDKCLQQKGSRKNQGNGLLSALHQAERVHLDDDDDRAGPSDAANKNHSGLADSSVLAEAGGNGNCSSDLYVSSSPIKSFTPISEATDCLIDFQQQYTARTSQRLGRKRKFKR